jgi:hypothetical protein
MVMTMCFLVYAALEYRISQTLAEYEESVPDQKGKPTAPANREVGLRTVHDPYQRVPKTPVFGISSRRWGRYQPSKD